MTPKYWRQIPSLLLLILILCTCDRAQTAFDPSGRIYTYDPGDTVPDSMPFYRQPFQVGDQLAFGADSVIRTNVFSYRMDTFPLRKHLPVDSLRTSLSYELAPDSSLRVSLWSGDTNVVTLWFSPHESTDQPLNIDEWVGSTFWLPGDTTNSQCIHFSFHSWRDGKIMRERHLTHVQPPYGPEASKALGESPAGYARFGMLVQQPHPFIRYIDGVTGTNINYQLGRNADGDPYMAYRTDNGRKVFRQILKVVESPVPHYVDESKLAERLNRGRIVIDRGFTIAEETGISFAYEEDFLRRGGLTLPELDHLEFYFDPQSHDYNFFVGDRAIKSGKWTLSRDRNYLILSEEERSQQTLLPLVAYDEGEIAFRFNLIVKTPRPRGKELLSYFELDALIKVQEG
jgi:hypothetical protein